MSDTRLHLQVTRETKRQLQREAKAKYLTLSAWVRMLIETRQLHPHYQAAFGPARIEGTK